MTDQTARKSMWTRCNACQERIYNSPHDIKVHRQHCPYDLQLTIQALKVAIFGTPDLPKGKESLTSRIEHLEDNTDSDDSRLDPDAIDPDAFTAYIDDDPEQTSQYAHEDLDAYATAEPATDTGNLRTFHPNSYFNGPDGAA